MNSPLLDKSMDFATQIVLFYEEFSKSKKDTTIAKQLLRSATSVGARHIHAHYAASILEGLKGAKHWLYRNTAWEPASGVAYREILAKHYKMCEALAELSDEITWIGINSVFIEQEKFT